MFNLVYLVIPVALQLRYLQTMREMAAENNTTTIFPFPMDIFRPLMHLLELKGGQPAATPSPADSPEDSRAEKVSKPE